MKCYWHKNVICTIHNLNFYTSIREKICCSAFNHIFEDSKRVYIFICFIWFYIILYSKMNSYFNLSHILDSSLIVFLVISNIKYISTHLVKGSELYDYHFIDQHGSSIVPYCCSHDMRIFLGNKNWPESELHFSAQRSNTA